MMRGGRRVYSTSRARDYEDDYERMLEREKRVRTLFRIWTWQSCSLRQILIKNQFLKLKKSIMLEDRIIVQDRGIDAGLAALMQKR